MGSLHIDSRIANMDSLARLNTCNSHNFEVYLWVGFKWHTYPLTKHCHKLHIGEERANKSLGAGLELIGSHCNLHATFNQRFNQIPYTLVWICMEVYMVEIVRHKVPTHLLDILRRA